MSASTKHVKRKHGYEQLAVQVLYDQSLLTSFSPVFVVLATTSTTSCPRNPVFDSNPVQSRAEI